MTNLDGQNRELNIFGCLQAVLRAREEIKKASESLLGHVGHGNMEACWPEESRVNAMLRDAFEQVDLVRLVTQGLLFNYSHRQQGGA